MPLGYHLMFERDSVPNLRFAVIGDVMLDCYLTGVVDRISPEAPVPVVRVQAERAVPGGAANVAANLASLGLNVSLVGLAGADAAHPQLVELLSAIGAVDCSGLLAVPGRRTTRKLRIIGGSQQLVRIDQEDIGDCSPEVETELQEQVVRAVAASNIVILSDYGKGTCSERLIRFVMTQAKAAGKKVLVDPKRNDLAIYQGAYVITPNRKELTDATGLLCETNEQAARAASKASRMSGANILLTRSEKGMSFFPVTGPASHLPTAAQDVFDVSGAGDTVIAVFAAALASDLPIAEAMRWANHAAGIVVSHLGTACVTREQLAAALAPEHGLCADVAAAVLDLASLLPLRKAWGRDRHVVGLASGVFEGISPAHIAQIARAAASCDRLVVAVTHDLEGADPARVASVQSRGEIVAGLKGVNATVICASSQLPCLAETLRPDVLIVGGDWPAAAIDPGALMERLGGQAVPAG